MVERYQDFLKKMQQAASEVDGAAWAAYAAAQHIDCGSRVRMHRYGPSCGGPYRGGTPGDWGRGRHGPPCHDQCPKLQANSETIESWKNELEYGSFLQSLEWNKRRHFQFAKLAYFCSDNCAGPECNRPLIFHKSKANVKEQLGDLGVQGDSDCCLQ